MRINDFVPNADTLLTLEPEELAGMVLQYLASLVEHSSSDLNRCSFTNPSSVARWSPNRSEEVARALTEAWIWLEREGLIAPKPGDQYDWFFVTRRGQRLAQAGNFSVYRKANLLPRGLLHPAIAQKVWATFLRGL
ncbi:MAG TPA: hypothetical protein VGX03_32350 [Candidatus Binatia bacterium]|jgi:hypothetical protein|nr:hypothetical protein [Candidatus Binatia bacterium]